MNSSDLVEKLVLVRSSPRLGDDPQGLDIAGAGGGQGATQSGPQWNVQQVTSSFALSAVEVETRNLTTADIVESQAGAIAAPFVTVAGSARSTVTVGSKSRQRSNERRSDKLTKPVTVALKYASTNRVISAKNNAVSQQMKKDLDEAKAGMSSGVLSGKATTSAAQLADKGVGEAMEVIQSDSMLSVDECRLYQEKANGLNEQLVDKLKSLDDKREEAADQARRRRDDQQERMLKASSEMQERMKLMREEFEGNKRSTSSELMLRFGGRWRRRMS